MSAVVVMLSGLASGQGKTSVTAALALAVRSRGRRVVVFKLGPDFIDPMVLERASGGPVFNLDDRMVGLAESRHRVVQAAEQADLVLIEGAMGLYDGPPSSASLARALGVPVVVLVDAGSMAQTFGAVVHGLASYGAARGEPVTVLGAVANRVASAGHAAMLLESLPPGCPLLAAVPRVAATLPERHLGLSSEAVAQVDEALQALAQAMQTPPNSDCIDRLLALPAWQPPAASDDAVWPAPPATLTGRRIAVARDAAFRFIYPANLACLEAMGASIEFFSPLNDEPVPASAHALWLPGGYPELFAEQLAAAGRWRASVQAWVAEGRPVLAECGGMMALADGLHLVNGERYAMAGVLDGEVRMQTRLAALGVQTMPPSAQVDEPHPALRGHTFHFSTISTPLQPAGQCQRLDGSAGEPWWRFGPTGQGVASYFHAYFPSSPLHTAALLGAAP